ncbi:MAG: hypothetical protein PVH53_11495, partial [Desulfobacterales bacterium]
SRGYGCSFATLPKSFRQCTISLLIIHSAMIRDWMEKRPDPSDIYSGWVVKSREERLLLSVLNRGLLFFLDLSNVFFDGLGFFLQIRQMRF